MGVRRVPVPGTGTWRDSSQAAAPWLPPVPALPSAAVRHRQSCLGTLCFPARSGLDPALLPHETRSGSCFAFPRHQVWKSLPLSSPSLSCPNHFHLTSLGHGPGFSLCTFIKNHPVEDPRFLLQLAASTRAPAATELEVPRGNTVPSNLTSSPPGITWLPGFLWASCILGQMSPASPQDTPNAGKWFALPGFCLILPVLQPTAGCRSDNLAITL